MAKETKVIIDVDVIINAYNKKHPNKRKLDRERLAEMMGVNKQLFSDWKSEKKKSPKWAKQLLILLEVGNVPVTKFITEKNV